MNRSFAPLCAAIVLSLLSACAAMGGLMGTNINNMTSTDLAQYLAGGGNPNATNGDGKTLLHQAVVDRPDLIAQLLTAGADPNLQSWNVHYSASPIVLAFQYNGNNTKPSEELLLAGANPWEVWNGTCVAVELVSNIINTTPRTPEGDARTEAVARKLMSYPGAADQECMADVLGIAIENGRSRTVAALLDGGMPLKRSYLGKYAFGKTWTPMGLAVSKNQGEMLKIMLKKGGKPSDIMTYGGQNFGAVPQAALYGLNSALKTLIEAKASLGGTGPYNDGYFKDDNVTPLAYAIMGGNTQGQKMLEKAGAPLKAKGSRYTRDDLLKAADNLRQRYAQQQAANQAAAAAQQAEWARQAAIAAQQQAEDDAYWEEQERQSRQATADRMANIGNVFANELNKANQQQQDALRGIEQAGAAGRREYEARQASESQSYAAAHMSSDDMTSEPTAPRGQVPVEKPKPAAPAPAPSSSSSSSPGKNSNDAGSASTQSDPSGCVTAPVLGPNKACGKGSSASITNNCTQPVDARICLRVAGKWDCGARYGLNPGQSWSYANCGDVSDTFRSVRSSSSKTPLAKP